MDTQYVIFTRSGVRGYEAQVIFDDYADVKAVVMGDDAIAVAFVNRDAVEQFMASRLELLWATADYKQAHDAARHGAGTLWEQPAVYGIDGVTNYVITRGPQAHVDGFYEIASFQP